MTKEAVESAIHGRLIVSCQALPGEPLYVEEKSIMYLMARAAKQAGASAIRTSSVRDVIAIREETGLPVIGLIKRRMEDTDIFITPTMVEVDALHAAGADVIALDCTARPRAHGLTSPQFLRQIREKYPQAVLMADIATYDEGMAAAGAGADLIGTTMSGYTPGSPKLDGPDLDLIARLAADVGRPVIAEGRIHTPEQAAKALALGAYAVVVGGAITRPLEIAARFVRAVEGRP